MFDAFKANWKTTVMGIGAKALLAAATTANFDKLPPSAALTILGYCLLGAIKDTFTADASKGETK